MPRFPTNGTAGHTLAVLAHDMILRNVIDAPRRKAVWGPKRVIGLGLMLLALAASCGRRRPARAVGGAKRGPALRATRSRTTRSTRELVRRSADRNKNNTTRVIVTLAPGAKLPAEFRKFTRRVLAARTTHNALSSLLGGNDDDNKLDLINGQLLERAERPAEADWRRIRRCSSCSTTGRSRPTTTAPRSPSARGSSRTFSGTPAPASASPSSTRGSPPGTTT